MSDLGREFRENLLLLWSAGVDSGGDVRSGAQSRLLPVRGGREETMRTLVGYFLVAPHVFLGRRLHDTRRASARSGWARRGGVWCWSVLWQYPEA